MISKYISKLLESHNRVILPDLGAFILKGEKLDTAYFNEFLRFNDGLLSEFICSEEKIDNAVANSEIKAFVENINKQLQEKRSIELEGLGTLYIDNVDKIQFTPLSVGSAPTPKPEVVVEPPKKAPVETPKKEEQSAEPITPKEVKAEKPVANEKAVTTEKAPVASKEKPRAATPQPKPQKKAVPVAEDTSWHDVPQPGQKKSKAGRILLILIIALVIIVGAAYYIFMRTSSNPNSLEQNIIVGSQPSETVPADSFAKAETTKTKPVEKPVTTTKPVSQPATTKMVPKTGKKYYVIAGCFAMEQNADLLVKNLNKQGYSAEKFAKIGELFYVCYSSFDDKVAANAELQNLKAKGVANAWIKKY